jgi:DNA primase
LLRYSVGFIPEEVIDQVLKASNIVDVVEGYLPLKQTGKYYRALCPFHTEKTPSFTVNPERQIFYCFGCGEGGDVFRGISPTGQGCRFRRKGEAGGERVS